MTARVDTAPYDRYDTQMGETPMLRVHSFSCPHVGRRRITLMVRGEEMEQRLCPECAREVAAALHEAIGLLEQQQQAEGGERGCGSKSTQLSAERCI